MKISINLISIKKLFIIYTLQYNYLCKDQFWLEP